jgi:Zn-dependent M28 family amino/carboxypeptidase
MKLRIGIIILLFSILLTACSINSMREDEVGFNSERAYQDVIHQLSLGPRIPGTSGHEEIIDWITIELQTEGWEVQEQFSRINDQTIRNLVASRGNADPYILIGAHYDTRIYADQDPDTNLKEEPVPGANDGGSGVAVLLELARVLPTELPVSVKLVFFDAEDNGGIGEWDWILGSRAFVRDADQLPESVVIVDMVGDAQLEIYYERNSDPALREEIWKEAEALGFSEQFIPVEKHSMLDDHTPFLEVGIPAVDIIDFDYPYWHTTGDTIDKVSPESLQAVGETLYYWLID